MSAVMTTPYRPTPALDPGPASTEARPSGWFRRVFATLLDLAILYGVVAIGLQPLVLLGAAAPSALVGLVPLAYVLGLLAYVALQVQQGRTGATLGKALLGLRVVYARNRQPIGVGASLARPFVHLLDTLPLYLGYLAPIVDPRRRTFTDMAMGTLVVRAPRVRPGFAVPLIATTCCLVALVGDVTAVSRSPEAIAALEELAEPAATSATPLELPAAPEPLATSALPADDVAGRIAPPAAGFVALPDAETELGPLTAEDVALQYAPPEDAPATAEALRGLGLVDGHGRGFADADSVYTVLVYRTAGDAAAAGLLQALTDGLEQEDPAVPDAIGLAPEQDGTLQRTLFARGAFVYEVSVLGDGAPVDRAELQRVTAHQRSHALVVA